MMKHFATVLLLLVISSLNFGQKTEREKVTVIWGPDASCHWRNSEAVKALKPRCSLAQVEDMTFQIIDFGGVSYAVTHRPLRDFLVASVQISNKTDAPMELIAKRSRLGRFTSPQDYAADAKAEFFTAQSQGELQQATYQEGEIGEREGGIRSGLKLRDRFEVDYNRGRIIRRPGAAINEPEPPPTENPVPSKITRELRIPRVVFDHVLKSKTLASGEKVAGHVVFKRPLEDTSYMVLYLNAGQFEFVFPNMPK